MSKFGLVEANVVEVEDRAKRRLKQLRDWAAQLDSQKIRKVQEEFATPRFFGLLKPKNPNMSRDEAAKVLDSRHYTYYASHTWQTKYGDEFALEAIIKLCDEAIKNGSKTIFLSDIAIKALPDD